LDVFDHFDEFFDIEVVGLGGVVSGTFLVGLELLDIPVLI
jgi:hypothetical protein